MGFFSSITNAISSVVSDVAGPLLTVFNPVVEGATALASGVLQGIAPELTSTLSTVGSAIQPFLPMNSVFGDVIGGLSNGSASATTGSSLSNMSSQMTSTLNALDQQMSSVQSQLNNPNMSMGQMIQLQAQVEQITEMFQLISQIMNQQSQTQLSVIHNIQA